MALLGLTCPAVALDEDVLAVLGDSIIGVS